MVAHPTLYALDDTHLCTDVPLTFANAVRLEDRYAAAFLEVYDQLVREADECAMERFLEQWYVTQVSVLPWL